MKIVINQCYGGFSLSELACKMLNCSVYDYNYYNKRNSPELIDVLETLGSLANSSMSNLSIVEIPDGIKWAIKEYDGSEWVCSEHQTWPDQNLEFHE